MKKKPKPITKGMFELDISIYATWAAVFVGVNHQQALALAKKQRYSKKFLTALNDDVAIEKCNNVSADTNVEGSVCKIDDYLFIFLPPYKLDWDYYDILNHEIFHLTQFVAVPRGFWDEIEPPAYLHTWLFKTIRKKLSGVK